MNNISVQLTIAAYSPKANDEVVRWSSEPEIKERTIFSIANTNAFCYLLNSCSDSAIKNIYEYEIVLCISTNIINRKIFYEDGTDILNGGIFRSWFYTMKEHTLNSSFSWSIYFNKLLIFGNVDRKVSEFVIEVLNSFDKKERICLL